MDAEMMKIAEEARQQSILWGEEAVRAIKGLEFHLVEHALRRAYTEFTIYKQLNAEYGHAE